MNGGLLDGQLAVVTAGTSGIGRAIVERFLKEGAEVIVTGLTAERIAEAQAAWGAKATVLRLDAGVLADLGHPGRGGRGRGPPA